MSAVKKLVVCGGSGFIGSRVCKYAVARGWEVTSISRSGEPRWRDVQSDPNPPAWSHKISWERADILQPATYAPLLKGVDFVIHSMGILLEANYKGVLSGRESPLAGMQRAFSQPSRRPLNPLARQPDAPVEPRVTPEQLTYEIMNRDSAIALAQVAARENAAAFVFMSAAGGAPILPARYITTKREAEEAIAKEFPKMRGIFMRPPFMYDSSRPITMALAGMVGAGAVFNSVTGKVLSGFMGAAGVKPLQADTVAEAIVEALSDETVRGPVEQKEIEELANRSWRKTMI